MKFHEIEDYVWESKIIIEIYFLKLLFDNKSVFENLKYF